MIKTYSIINDKLYRYDVLLPEKEATFSNKKINDIYRERNGGRLSVTNTIITDITKTNIEKYTEAKTTITDKKIKGYDILVTGSCKLLLNITFLDKDGSIIEEGIRVHNVGLISIPVMYLAKDNDLKYTICNKVYTWLPRLFTRDTGLGIHKEYEKISSIRINSITLLADVKDSSSNSDTITKISPTIIDKTLTPDSHTIELVKNNRIQLFNDENGHVINVADNVDYVEYFINITFDSGSFVTTDDSIDELLKANH